MTHDLIEHELNEADPRQRSSDMDDDRGNVEEMSDPFDDQENMDDEPISDSSDEDFDDSSEDEPSSNERRGYGHVPRQR